jgi:two-component system chemotaxis response regulator CheB
MLPEDKEWKDPSEFGTAAIEEGPLPGPPTALTCPDCGGAIWEMVEGEVVRYRCHVGHAYTADSMVGAQAAFVEAALWSAVRALEEKAQLSRRLAERSRNRGLARLATRYADAEKSSEHASAAIRQLLLKGAADPVMAESGESQSADNGNSGNQAAWSHASTGGDIR